MSHFFLSNNVLLTVAAGSVLLGTLYPLIVESLGMGQAFGWSTLFQSRVRATHGAGDVSDGDWTNRALEESESSGSGDEVALGFCDQRAERGGVAISLWTVEVARESRLALAIWIVTTALVNVWERVRVTSGQLTTFQKLRMQSRSYYGMQVAHLGCCGVHHRRDDGDRISIGAGCADAERATLHSWWVRV